MIRIKKYVRLSDEYLNCSVLCDKFVLEPVTFAEFRFSSFRTFYFHSCQRKISICYVIQLYVKCEKIFKNCKIEFGMYELFRYEDIQVCNSKYIN